MRYDPISELKESFTHTDPWTKSVHLIVDSIPYCRDFFPVLNDLRYIETVGIPDRFYHWVRFWFDHYPDCTSAYVQLVKALVKGIRNTGLLRNQTQYQFEMSKAFYKRVWSSGVHVILNNENEGRFFLIQSLLYGCYPNLLSFSLSASLKSLVLSGNLKAQTQMFGQLFAPFKLPSVLVRHLHLMTDFELDCLVQICHGKNLRKCEDLTLSISKKESYFLENELPENLHFENEILDRSIIAAQLLKEVPGEPLLLVSLLESSAVFRFNLTAFYSEMDFWKSVFRFLCTVDFNQNENIRTQEYVDYLEYQRYQEDENFSMKGRTQNSIAQLVYDWRGFSLNTNPMDYFDMAWPGLGLESWETEMDGKLYRVEEIRSGKDLFTESNQLGHCVFSYLRDCSVGNLAVFGLRVKLNEEWKPSITIEVGGKAIVQAAGKFNRKLNSSEWKVMEEWGKHVHFPIRLDTFEIDE